MTLATVVQAASSLAPRLTIEQDSQRRGMVLSSQGTSGRKAIEFSTDLIQWTELGGTDILYVVDHRQSQHLTQVIRAAEKAAWLTPPRPLAVAGKSPCG